MKREGRQHGMVRTYRILPDALPNHTPRFVNQIHTQPTAGMFAKVSTKPTNHSKSTGLSNSKANKSKRRNNHKGDIIFNDDIHFAGASASGVLNSLNLSEDEYEEPERFVFVGHCEDDFKDQKVEESNEGQGDDDDIVADEDGGSVTVGEMVILLEQINEEDWCFVGADA